MEQKERKSVSYYMRALHRDIGFFVVGFICVYALSGIVLVYRDTDFLMREVQIEKKLSPGLDADELGKTLRIKGFKILKTEGDTVSFKEGTYNKTTGLASYQLKQLPSVLQKFVDLHKTMSGRNNHWFALLFGVLLGFLAISSFWMYKKDSSAFRRGIYITSAGIVLTIIVLFL